MYCYFFSSRRRHTRYWRDWSSDVCSSDLTNVILQLGSRTCRSPYTSFTDISVHIAIVIGRLTDIKTTLRIKLRQIHSWSTICSFSLQFTIDINILLAGLDRKSTRLNSSHA